MIPHFELLGVKDGVRRGRYHTVHGSFETPCFAPVGTYATIKGLTPDQIRATGSELILANSYHLHVRPTPEVVRKAGGLHEFMSWDGPILTDSGGYQVFSLDDRMKIDDEGVTFQCVINGSPRYLTPERVLEVQRDLGPDIAMVLDHCPPGDAGPELTRAAHERTLLWARRSRDLHEAWGGAARGQAVFGIVQGGIDPELRAASAESLKALEFDGYAVGGLSVGETKEQMNNALASAVPQLPEDKIRYLMGVGTPEDFQTATRAGVDLFDCVTPSRHGRNHTAFSKQGIVKMRNLQYAEDPEPIDPDCGCYTCRNFSRSYLRHLSVAKEMLAGTLLSIHNITFFQGLMAEIRASVAD
ncbi:MAG: tRNA guanosine(34) transglycosylase Tgt [Planctomycetota bacterium]|nr:tRNA guanosine(34) transglycosylase Tgt [Planctomycetota bacterium]